LGGSAPAASSPVIAPSLDTFASAAAMFEPLAEAVAEARVLVVDDEPEMTELLRAILEGAGYEVASAESGSVALQMLAETSFDAMVCDLRMPAMDGAALWRAIAQTWPDLAGRMLFVTGDTLSAGAQQFLQSSGCPSLDKPFSKPELLAKLAALLPGTASHEGLAE
jgi:CheY-like chemotaxis protein